MQASLHHQVKRSAKVLPLYLIVSLFLLACGSKPTPEEEAAQAALSYYNRILEGYPDGLLAAKAGCDSLPSDYREQLKETYQQYLRDIQRRHGGLTAIELSQNPPRRDSIRLQNGTCQHVVYASLLLSFNDSTREEITVPMIQQKGKWLLK